MGRSHRLTTSKATKPNPLKRQVVIKHIETDDGIIVKSILLHKNRWKAF